jgi:protein SCO1/2
MKLDKQGQRILIVAILFIITLVAVFSLLNKTKKLPIYEPSDVNPELVDSTLQNQISGHTILPFSLENQDGDIITEKRIEGKIAVVDFFFTTCGSICPRMTNEMKRVNEAFVDDADVHFLSYTVYPEVDSVATLKAYAENKGLNTERWDLLTGPKEKIYPLARKSYFAVIDEPSLEGPDFIHTENFVLVDNKGRLRGFYDGTDPQSVDVLIEDIKLLQNEKE